MGVEAFLDRLPGLFVVCRNPKFLRKERDDRVTNAGLDVQLLRIGIVDFGIRLRIRLRMPSFSSASLFGSGGDSLNKAA